MSDSSSNIPSSSQESEVVDDVKSKEPGDLSEVSSIVTSSASESEKTESVKLGLNVSTPSKIAKPSALKLPVATGAAAPTRIGRLCNNIPKPAIPPNPCQVPNGTGVGEGGTMSTMSSIRKISDELARKRLTDVDEIDENSVPFFGGGKWVYDRKMSSGSAISDSSRKSDELRKKRSSDTSMSPDSYSDYWKSDFEPRRASDASVVLTEDTDQFIIGDRVWVGGIKSGQIAYIGETQFAPGEWAGIVLDEPIGKNDGTVANIRYFQCEPKKGIFSRLTRLTRYPLVEGGAGEPAAPRPVSVESRKSNGNLLASVPKKSSLVLTPSANFKNSISKPSSPDSALHPGVSVGDRVIVKSSQGSKAGILRYLGTTDFAAGEWCGVELDDPLGKNDGSVSGTRYFECRPKFGLFAPLHKVSKSPANKRLSQPCVVHPRGGGTTGIRRQGSKESLVSLSSNASTAASIRSTTNRKIGVRTPTTPTSTKNALQETLKEKELRIEQLLKERDLERAEVTRAASQADEAERRLILMKQEFEQQKEEAEARISDLEAMVCLIKSENEELASQLEDEKKKFEDLQFRFEEETIDKADIKSVSLKYEEKMKILEKMLFEERKRTETLEQDSNKLFEAEEQMVFLKDELDLAKEKIIESEKTTSNLKQTQISLEAQLTSAWADVESLKIENQSLKTSASQDSSNLRENLQAFEESKKELRRKQEEVEKLSKEIQDKDQGLIEKEKELHAKYLTIINELTEKHKSETAKKCEDLKNNSETKFKLLESQLEEKMKICNSLEEKLNEANILLSKSVAEKSVEQTKQKEAEDKLQKEVRDVREELEKKNGLLNEEIAKSEKFLKEKEKLQQELAEMKNSLASAFQSTDKQVSAMNDIVSRQKEDLNNANMEIDKKSKECEFFKELMTTTKKEHEVIVEEMEKVLKMKNSELKKTKEDLENMKRDFDSKNTEIKDLYESHEEGFKSKIKNLENAEVKRKGEMDILRRDLESTKKSLEARENEVKSEQTNSKNLAEKLTVLEENFMKVSQEKDQLQLEAGDIGRKLQAVEEKLNQVTNQKFKLEADISNFINSSNDSSLQLTKLNQDLRAKEKEMDLLQEDISQKTRNFEHVEQELKQILEKQEADIKALKEDYEKATKEYGQEAETLKTKLVESSTVLLKSEDEWKKKMAICANESEIRIKNLEDKIRNLEKKEVEDRSVHEEYVKNLINAQSDLEKKLRETETESREVKISLEKKIEDLNAERTSLLEVVEKTKEKFLEHEKQVDEKVKIDSELHASESEKLRNELKETNVKLAATLEELSKAKEQKNKLNEEKSKLEATTAAIEELLKQTQMKNTELEVNASSIESENKMLKGTINQLREEKCIIDKDITEKMVLVAELKSQMEALEYSKKTQDIENEIKIKNLEEETTELKQKIQKTETVHSVESAEKNKQLESLKKEIDSLKQEATLIVSGKEKDVETINAVVGQLKKDLEDNRYESERKSEKISKIEKNLQQVKVELEAEKKKNEEYGKRYNASETERIDLKERFEEQSKLLVNNFELSNKLEEVSKKLREAEKREQEVVNNSKLEREILEKMLETTNGLLSQREKETKALSNEVESLKQEKISLLNNKILVESQEKEKMEVKKEVQENKQASEKALTNANIEDPSQRQLLEEREFAKGQVDFLNSVIVDMQKKNDALKARIEILEMGFTPEDVDEFSLHNITTKSVAPRLFCDICDRFDLHDTEDCPTQAMDDLPPPKSSKTKTPPPERPYCEICEVFGHDTADCDDAETF